MSYMSDISSSSSSDRKWFLCADGVVSGPYDQNIVNERVANSPQSLIWGRGLPDWISPQKWKKIEGELEKTISQHRVANERLWKLKVGDEEQPPMIFEQMLAFLRTRHDYGEMMVWTEGYSEWKELFQIHKIMDELGVPRRRHPRVPLMGQVSCEGATGIFNGRVLSISEGGLGFTDSEPVKIGEKFKIIIKSPNLYLPIHATAEVVYVGNDGYVGMKFIGLQSESKSAIIEYVKKLVDSGSVKGV